jgi:hypothetical protein
MGMSKTVRLLVSLVALGLIVASGGCSHKPAYSELDTNRNSKNQNHNGETQTAAQPTAGTDAPQASASQPVPAQAEPAKPTTASFMTAAGAIKDLPSYPRAVRVNVQYGPVQQAMVMTLLLHTRDSMEKVQAFYTQAIKENHWTVTDKLLDPELSEWTLNKDERNNAKVEVKKDPRTGSLDISIVRAEKFEAPPK